MHESYLQCLPYLQARTTFKDFGTRPPASAGWSAQSASAVQRWDSDLPQPLWRPGPLDRRLSHGAFRSPPFQPRFCSLATSHCPSTFSLKAPYKSCPKQARRQREPTALRCTAVDAYQGRQRRVPGVQVTRGAGLPILVSSLSSGPLCTEGLGVARDCISWGHGRRSEDKAAGAADPQPVPPPANYPEGRELKAGGEGWHTGA